VLFLHIFHDLLQRFLLLNVQAVAELLLVLPIVDHLCSACAGAESIAYDHDDVFLDSKASVLLSVGSPYCLSGGGLG